jgi:hypothetical protein
VEQGDNLGRPASVLASARRGPAGTTTRVGGLAVVRDGHRGDDQTVLFCDPHMGLGLSAAVKR